MHTKISQNNPYGNNRWGFAWEKIEAGGGHHLDYGCHDGAFLNALKNKGFSRLVGVDVSQEAIDHGKKLYQDIELMRIEAEKRLPFDNGTFSSITILDVLEHVYEQRELLSELNRVLVEGGDLVVTVPGKHFFSFMDIGNLKFRFPKLHRWHYLRSHSREEYDHKYACNPNGLIGDISSKKRWHEHFSRKKLEALLCQSGFCVVEFDGSGFFPRLIGALNYFVPRRCKSLGRKLAKIDAKRFESTNLFCVAEKNRKLK